MKSLWINLILIAALIVATSNPLVAQTPEQLYQKGLMKEEGEGKLQDAIDLYTQVADNSNASQSLQAKALLHVGMCYEKLGAQEAVKAYQRLVNNFPGQKNEVAIARDRLSRLMPQENIQQESEEIAIRQVWAGKGVDQLGSVSANGEYLTFVDWETGNLAIRDLKTGENKPLTNEGSWNDPRQYAIYSQISPDATQVVYMWNNAEGIPDLRLIKVGNPTPVILYTPGNKDEAMAPAVWFSDGNNIIAQKINRKNKTLQLFSINLIIREIQLLIEKVPGPFFLSNFSLSTDEKQIAYDIPNPSDKNTNDINLLSLDTKTELPLIKHPANDALIGWLPGRNELLFTSDRSGTNDIWVVNTSDMKSFDMPKRILNNIGEIRPMGFRKDGTLYYAVQSDIFESFILPVDQITGKLSDNPRIALSGHVFDACWLPDGESLICRRYSLDRNYSLCIYNIKTGEIQPLADDITATGSLRISPDGKSVLVQGTDKLKSSEYDYEGGIYSIDIKTGKSLEILRFSKKNDFFHSSSVEWDKEGKCVFYASANHIIKHDVVTGGDKIIYTDKNLFFNPALRRSFDGKHLLFDGVTDLNEEEKLNEGETYLFSIPEEGGEVRILCKVIFPGHGLYKRISLSPDGKDIYFSAKTPLTESVLYRIPADGGTPEIVWQSNDYYISGISIHPDGKQIALSTSATQIEIRSIENLDNEVNKVFSKIK